MRLLSPLGEGRVLWNTGSSSRSRRSAHTRRSERPSQLTVGMQVRNSLTVDRNNRPEPSRGHSALHLYQARPAWYAGSKRGGFMTASLLLTLAEQEAAA